MCYHSQVCVYFKHTNCGMKDVFLHGRIFRFQQPGERDFGGLGKGFIFFSLLKIIKMFRLPVFFYLSLFLQILLNILFPSINSLYLA